MKLLFVFGTRPEAFKLAPVIRELVARPEFDRKREMLAQAVELFDLRPDWNLEVMRPNQDLAYITGAELRATSSQNSRRQRSNGYPDDPP